MLVKFKKSISISLYWKCQLIGWGMVSLLWLYIALVRDQFTVFHALINYSLDVSLCIVLTHMYRGYALKANWNKLNINKLLIRVIPSVILLSIGFMLVMNLKMSGYVYFVSNRNIFSENLFAWNPVLITGLRHMSIWVLGYHLYHFYEREVNTAKANAQLSIIAKQAQLDNLSAQLNPHFLFNSLNSIKSLIVENPKTARRAIDLLSDLLRTSLYEKDHDLITIAEELTLVNDYVELEKLRFEERLNVNIDLEGDIKHLKIPPLSIQLLVENAIKHGIDKHLDGGVIYIVIKKVKSQIEITVKNPGNLKAKEQNGLGLQNLRKRLSLQYKNTAQFKIEATENDEVLATLIIPVNL